MRTYFKAVLLLLMLFISTEMVYSVLAATLRPPKPRCRAEIEAVLAKAPKPPTEDKLRKLNIILVADTKDHGLNEHDYPLWQKRWKLLLGGKIQQDKSTEKQVNLYGHQPPDNGKDTLSGAPKVKVNKAWQWPSPEQFKSADVIVAFCYLKWNSQRIEQLRQYLNRGGGFVVVHPASWPQPEPLPEAAELLGVGGYKLFRHGPVKLKIVKPDHPICLGLPETINFYDESYWPPVPDIDPAKVKILATSDEKVSKNTNETAPQLMYWTYNYGAGRVFGYVLGYYTWTFDDPYFRILLLRGMAWAAGESPYRFDNLVMRGIPLSK